MKKILMMLTVISLYAMTVNAAPVYVLGNECPSDAQMNANDDFTRQYFVDPAIACVYDPAVNNIQGTTAEADTYLDILGTGTWTGLGQDFTSEGDTSGTFTIDPTLNYDQFAVGLKDGGLPKWAIFLLPAGVETFDWGFTGAGELSHFALYGYTGSPIINPTCPSCPPDDDEPPTAVPEPMSLLLVGSGLIGGISRYRRRS